MGSFDDLIPQKQGGETGTTGGAFDDLIPNSATQSSQSDEYEEQGMTWGEGRPQRSRSKELPTDEINQLGQGATFGLLDEAQAAILATVGVNLPESMGGLPDSVGLSDAYTGIRDEIRSKNDQFAEENPKTALALNAAGGLATGGLGAAKVAASVPKAITTGGKVTKGAAISGTEGAIAGAGYSDADNAGDLIADTAKGAGLGVATGAAVAGGLSYAANRAAKKSQLASIAKNNPDARVAGQKLDDAGNLIKDKTAQEAIKQGINEPFIAAVKASNPSDKAKMRTMVKKFTTGRQNARYRAMNRPSDVVGESVMQRVNVVTKASQRAASQLDSEAAKLKGQQVNVSGVVDGFLDELESIGVTLDDKLKPIYQGSDLEGIKGGQKVVNNIVNRMRDTKTPDAYDIHRLKKFIDENVTYGKSKGGLTGNAERMMKGLRHNLDSLLDETFDSYNKVNTQYAQTRGALDDFQKAIGTTIDLTSSNANKSVGTATRTVLSNAKGRVRVMDALEGLDSVAKAQGGKMQDDLVNQLIFVDELETMFGSSAQTSLQGETGKAIQNAAKKSMREQLVDGVAGAADKARGISEENKIRSLRLLLTE